MTQPIPELGEKLCHKPTGTVFAVTRRTKLKNGGVKLNGEYLLSDCMPDESKRELRDDEIEALKMVVDCILVGEESIEWLSALEPQHKAQLWQYLSNEQREGLKQLGGKRNAA